MLSFLRKIRKKLLGTGNVKGYLLYAVGEITLIVIGILLALQINNWNERVREQKQEIQILESIQSEFQANKESLQAATGRANGHQRRCQHILQHTGSNFSGLTKRESDSLIYIALNNFVSVELSDAILKDLISTGRIHLIRNDSLKQLLHSWEKAVYEVREIETILYNETSTIIAPFLNKNYSAAIDWSTERYGYSSGFNLDYRKIYAMREFENIVIGKMRLYRLAQRDYKELEKVVDAILENAAKELQNKTV